MIRRKSESVFFIEKLVDQVIVYFSWLLAYWFRFLFLPDGELGLYTWYYQLGFLLVIVSVYFFKNMNVYASEHLESLPRQMLTQVKSNLMSLFVFVVMAFFLTEHRVSRIALVSYFVISTLILLGNKIIFRTFFLKKSTNAVLLGDGKAASDYREKVSKIPNFYIKGTSEQEINEQTDLIVIAYGNKDYQKVEELLNKYNEEIIPVILLPDIQSSVLGHDIQSFKGIPMIVFNEPIGKSISMFFKRSLDILLSLFGILILSPLLMILAAIIKFTSKGPILYSQIRVGADGKKFKMWKFRSMRSDSKNHQGWTVKDDPRVTRIGKIIRKTSLDELPQLINVLTGDMSLVGPRPERPQYVDEFKKEIPAYMLRHKMKAGITGWAQINGWRGDTSISRRIECDLWYIKNWSLKLDLSIILMTVWKGFVNKNAY